MAGRGGGAAGARRGAHRGQKRELYRGRCELRARGSAGGWRRAIHHGHAHPTGRPRRAPPAGQCSGGGGCQCRLGLLGRRPAPRRFQAGQTHAPALAASPVVTSGGAMSAWPRGGRLAARTALERRTARAILHRTGDPRVPCAAVEWHGLMVRYGHGSATAIGALGRRSPGQPVAAQSSPGARRTQQADVVRDLRALWATTRRRPPSTGVVRDSSTEAQTSNWARHRTGSRTHFRRVAALFVFPEKDI